jgi:hypothetical protein
MAWMEHRKQHRSMGRDPSNRHGRREVEMGHINKKKFLILFRIILKISVQRTGKFLIPIKYRNCYFFSVS